MKKIRLGSIELSDRVVVSDPCYNRDTWCMDDNVPIKPGNYDVFLTLSDEKEWGTRVASLLVANSDFIGVERKRFPKWEVYSSSIGVDSGQCGIFDNSVYPQKNLTDEEIDSEDSFYSECCDITLKKLQGGILRSKKGVVTSSGYGDGSYELSVIKQKGENVALMLDYSLQSMRGIMEKICERSCVQ